MDLFLEITKAKTIGISGHIRPDGDCIGAVLGLYNYILKNYNMDFTKKVEVYLEGISKEYHFLKNYDKIQTVFEDKEPFDLFISLDCGSNDRLGSALKYFKDAKKTFCIDHHISNTAYAMKNIVFSEASATCEVLFDLFDKEKIDKSIAECLFLGIVHDTGVFKHSNTKEHTMKVAGKLISFGINFSKMIDESFYEKTYVQNQILGRCLLESMLLMEGKVIASYISKKIQDFYHVTHEDLDGVIDQLRVTKGVEVALFISEEKTQSYKVSMRSNNIVDVSKIAVFFGGGGHIRAAGCIMSGSIHDVINNLTAHIEHQIKGFCKDA